jgi:hypothetical protein
MSDESDEIISFSLFSDVLSLMRIVGKGREVDSTSLSSVSKETTRNRRIK